MKKILLVTFLLLGWALATTAAEYRPVTPLLISTEYVAAAGGAAVQLWRVVPEPLVNGGVRLAFMPGAEPNRQAVCYLTMTGPVASPLIEWRGSRASQIKTGDNGLLLVHGFPAPANMLPVAVGRAPLLVTEKSVSGGRQFLKNYLVRAQEITLEAAMEQGWVRVSLPAGARLRLVTVRREPEAPDDEAVIRQLWATDDDWWLFEQTPHARSWRLPNP